MNQEKIGRFIAEKRKEKKITQEQLAEKLGVTDRAVSNWENGKNMPDLSIFKLLCNELDISINELMSGEELEDSRYIKTLEENIITMVNDIEIKKKRKVKWLLIFLIIMLVIGWCFYNFYLIDIKYDSRVIVCNVEDDVLNIYVNGQSVWNTDFVIKQIDNEDIYLVHSTINVYNKRRSNWEYSQSMAKLLDDKVVIFQGFHHLEVNNKKIKVYYTDERINKLKRIDNDDEIKKIINNSYLMCKN